MFITSFGEQNITYKCCSNFLIHLSKHTIIEKNNQIMICEINHRNEPDERIFIRTGRRKKIEKSGRFIIAEYSKKPTGKELKNDLTKYL
ncbi:hypothetical protein GPS43_11270 [Acinetobacter haemolyticus]|nr:hypothetical protein [Acinetobacter haemolyticus]